MDLKKRLAQFDRLSGRQPTSTAVNECQPDLVERTATDLVQTLGLHCVDTAWGPLWIRERATRRPTLPAGDLARATGVFTGELPGDLRADQLLFLDTETTGLAGGTGSLAFLVGVGWWTSGQLKVRQYFLQGPGHELPILCSLAELSGSFRATVTFNGNGFDLPLLRTRALLARCPDPFAQLQSLDLLTAARRLWGRRLVDCRQQTLEASVCGRPRGAGDIDGSQIPQAYFDYLQTGESGLLPRVLRHNRRDIGGMAYLLRAVLTRVHAMSRVSAAVRATVPWQDAWANGRICEQQGERELAAAWLDTALVRQSSASGGRAAADNCPEAFFRDAVRILKRSASWSRVEQVIHSALHSHGDLPWLHREAAILYEHRLGRLDAAWRHAQHCGEPQRLKRLSLKLARRQD